jgi:hypothetical protein
MAMPEAEHPADSPAMRFTTDGSLADAALADLDALGAAAFGAAITALVDELRTLGGRARLRAATSVEEVANAALATGRDVLFDVPGLVELYRQTSADPWQSDVSQLIVRLLLNVDRDEVMSGIPTDASGLSLRGRLARALDDASGTDTVVAAEDSTVRAIDFETAGAPPSSPPPADWSGDAAAPEWAPPDWAPTEPAPAEFPPPGSTALPELEATAGAEPEPSANGHESAEANGGSPPTSAPPAGEPAPSSPTYRAYGLLDCPEVVLAGTTIPLEFGLSEHAAAGVAGPPIDLPDPFAVPDPEAAAYTILVQLFADGFDLAPGERWRHELKISSQHRFPTGVVHLIARDLPDTSADRTITATFSIEGETLGVAIRQVRVTRDDQELHAAIPLGARASGTNITAPTGEPPAHVTITITRGVNPGALQWGIASSVPGVELPADRPTISDVGGEPKEFALAIIKDLAVKGEQAGLFQLLQGIGKTVRDEMPRAVREALATAARAVAPETLQVLILTEEPFVPWELAWIDEAFDPKAPQFLGAQANVGRWILDPDEPTDPPRTVTASSMAVVSGVYTGPSLQRLEAAEEEAKLLQEAYRATPIDATPDPVTNLLDGVPAADILHFAVHGKYDPQSPAEGLYLVSGPPIGPLQIRGGNLKARAPFVFLNACQVGTSQTLLGNYGGMAQAFLKAGAAAVVAPLWSIDDKVAQQIALEFYRQSLKAAQAETAVAEEPPPVADLLRRARRELVANAAAPNSTYLAYQFYGHPSMRLTWRADPSAGGTGGG